MKLEIKIDGASIKELEKEFSGPEAKGRIMKGLRAGAFLIQSTAQQSILGGGKTGKVYGKRKHRASAPGEPPANDTGTLVRGIQVKPGNEELTMEVHSIAAYAGFLEYGTSKMAPRPYLEPAATKNADGIAKLIADELVK